MSHANPCQSPTSPATVPEVVPEPVPSPRQEGRDAGGRFTKGNRGGFGNPFARRTAAFRRALAEAVNDDTIAAVVRKLAELAQAGDVAAIKLFLAYTVGKPTPAVNPDTLDVEEYRQYLQEPADLEPLGWMATRPSLDFLVETVRIVRPGLDQAHTEDLLRQLDEREEADRQAAAQETAEETARGQAPEADEGKDTMFPKEESSGERPAHHAREVAGSAPSDNGVK
jgi:hypothetical protein